ncbi:MAG: family 1 glycosylhydrolase, partial [Candidatus Eremiobacteraeota bacterium]|nr:family 1 glycosylhydrolase [Candidatus Eremiobacteraeota bacterium]
MDTSGVEIWGGFEPTVCRIGDAYFDQTVRSGHETREDDLDRVACLGIKQLRYPVLWERIAPEGLKSARWQWTDERLDRMRRLGITPIVTLLHHGSGPRDTSLLDPDFPEKLACFASAVARRYPWLRYFTPINEPLTTARFSALYGWWYPHRRDETSFYRALFNQVAAIGRTMNAVREIIPDALLMATEDLGKTYATPALQYQADHDNARRFLTYDLLCGRLELNASMKSHLSERGFRVDEKFQREMLCPPDLLGFNYYVTGERWLDDRLSRYPAQVHGGNGREAYVDVEAVRVCVESIAGAGPLLEEQWQRYGRPMAVTEAHIACTREEQLRWVRDIFQDLVDLRSRRVDVRALTIWSLAGAFDWNSALTRQDGYYESGAFDVSNGSVRETAVARYTRQLATGEGELHPALEGRGWWRLTSRLAFPPAMRTSQLRAIPSFDETRGSRKPIAIFGGDDPVARALREACRERNLEFRVISADENTGELAAYLQRTGCWVAIDCTGADTAWDMQAQHADSTMFRHFATVAHACRQSGVPLVAISSPLVFSGREKAINESTPRNPATRRGELYLEIEELLQVVAPRALIVRTGIPFGGRVDRGWHDAVLAMMLNGRRADVSGDHSSVVDRDDLVRTLLDFAIDGERGVLHVANAGKSSATEILQAA